MIFRKSAGTCYPILLAKLRRSHITIVILRIRKCTWQRLKAYPRSAAHNFECARRLAHLTRKLFFHYPREACSLALRLPCRLAFRFFTIIDAVHQPLTIRSNGFAAVLFFTRLTGRELAIKAMFRISFFLPIATESIDWFRRMAALAFARRCFSLAFLRRGTKFEPKQPR